MRGEDQRSLFSGLTGDGRPLLSLTGTALILSAGFGILQSISGYLLPHDSAAIGMDAAALSRAGNSHLVHFMLHDRVAFCGTFAIGAAYWWLAAFPLKEGRQWACWAYAVLGARGFLLFSPTSNTDIWRPGTPAPRCFYCRSFLRVSRVPVPAFPEH
jgi:hypothetical protein